ncbi:Uncharacterized protein BM_BM1413 [Brugia malayi]|uniref:Uncharacterized protein n=2 Tax=Brugia TaxID=6278 RepID=A0A7I4NK80_BRUMA|nr:Uncharacterized protein BM_BM1413 [Brugia malayi]VDO33954.1 unnamed protein product [Brugia timori]VIO93740.1 Uncharacterized protein BM_BM1413 [Brugia malayi]
MLKLTSVEILLVIFIIYGKETIWNCYENYQECVAESNKTDHINVDNVGSHNLIEFCSHYTQNILLCLAKKLGLTKSMSVSTFSLLLVVCEAETKGNISTTIEVQRTLKHLARLYAYLCAYSNIMDLHRDTECFQYLMKRCVLNMPDDSCMFYHCGKLYLNLSGSPQKNLSTQQQQKTTKTIKTVNQRNQLTVLKNHQDRTTALLITILIFIGMTQ